MGVCWFLALYQDVRGREREREGERERECVCVCWLFLALYQDIRDREREREKDCVCVCAGSWLCTRMQETEREREFVCVCVCVCAHVSVCGVVACVCVKTFGLMYKLNTIKEMIIKPLQREGGDRSREGERDIDRLMHTGKETHNLGKGWGWSKGKKANIISLLVSLI